ncbi:MmcB family DNA repair protein [Niallia endozanthoxylica]|uniref:MmcB family DNA repair protein n=1 Tax=Niallia endozanthoxylica TaxID=2036016 RepID=A0A5J5GXT5_9BACI|nr:MmcB family DNA repair protein [Niallia endozanthoxylica]KAA9013055.1 MmcB family DNA repair protein [Niallia endozanthoxylica]
MNIIKATITGNDSLSKRILLDIDNGAKVSEIPTLYPITLDQAKKLSQFKKMLDLMKQNLGEEYYNRLQLLGIKSLPLSSLFRQADWGGIIEILSVVTEETTRDELQLLITALKMKRERIQEFKEEADVTLSELEDTDKSLRAKEKELIRLSKEINGKMSMFNKYPEPFRSFLAEYLGLYEGELVLAKRLNVNWQRSLLKEAIIVYNKMLYMFFIKDLSSFVESLMSRHKRGLEYRWNPDQDIKRITKSTPWEDVPYNGKYRVPTSFSDSLVNSINEVNHKLEEIQNKKLATEHEFKKMKNKIVQSYMEMAETSDYLSTRDIKRHKELQDKALKWLFQRGFIAVTELTLPNGKKVDIFAYNESQIVIFEIKVSQGDLTTDQKWMDYLPYCHEFYLLTPSDLKMTAALKIKEVNCGQYVETANSIKLIRPDERIVKQVNYDDKLKFTAGQLLSRKFIYGY